MAMEDEGSQFFTLRTDMDLISAEYLQSLPAGGLLLGFSQFGCTLHNEFGVSM